MCSLTKKNPYSSHKFLIIDFIVDYFITSVCVTHENIFFLHLFILAGELCNTVQDAFLIAVEQQARERLQRLSALKRITPVDISQLSIKVRDLLSPSLSLCVCICMQSVIN